MIFKNYKYKDNILNFSIIEKEINGITGKETKNLVNIIKLNNSVKGKIIVNNNELTKEEINKKRKEIIYIDSEINQTIYHQTIYDLLYYEIASKKIQTKNINKKIIESLKIVGLTEDILVRNFYNLSSSEKKLIQVARALLSNPNILIFNEPFKFLDMRNEKKLIMLLNRIKDQYNKTIILVSNNSNILYKYTNHLIIFKNNKILIEGNTSDIYIKIPFLIKNRIEIPEIVEFTYLANKQKNANLEYHKDIRDIIKDIYKHV